MSDSFDTLFRGAVAAIDAGDVSTLDRLIAEHPRLVRDRLEVPGPWLRDKVRGAVDGFFRRPYLLWFIAEDPVRNGRLPASISEVARTIVDAARRASVDTLQEQIDYALTLVSWSWIARESGVQIDLIDVLIDAGADPDRNADNALMNGNFAAAAHLVERGAALTLAAALCLDRWDDADRLAETATDGDRQFALVLAALKGRADALRRAITYGVALDTPSADLYSHAPALHHAVGSGSLEAVQVLVEAGARLDLEDAAWHATPVGWAEYYQSAGPAERRDGQWAEIAAYLRERTR